MKNQEYRKNKKQRNSIQRENKVSKKILPVCLALLSAAASTAFLGCSSTSSDSVSSSVSAALSSIMASDMVVASPVANRTTTQSLGAVEALATLESTATPEEKKTALTTLLAATASSCAITLNIVSSGNANCYGPSVNYTQHEFNASSGSWPGGDLGIWEESESSGEACAAAQLNQRIKGVASLSDLGTFVVGGMACVAKKNSLSLPGIGETVDLASAMSGLVTINGSAVTVTTASLAREANDSSGNPVRVASLVGSSGTKVYNIRLKHVTTNATETTYKGKVSVSIAVSDGTKPGNCSSSSATGYTDAISVAYEKSADTSAKFELKTANFCGSDADPFVSTTNSTVDLTKRLDGSTPKGWGNNAHYMLADFDPATYLGVYRYAWQAGTGDSHTRTFNAKVENATAATGTAYFGFGPTIQSTPGSIDGMICAWTGPEASNHTSVSKVQKQVMALDTASGKFISSSANITYDPVNDCEATGVMAMNWNGGASTRNVSDTTENLAALSDVAATIGTAPTAPAEVD